MTSWNYVLGVAYFICAFAKQILYRQSDGDNIIHRLEQNADVNENQPLRPKTTSEKVTHPLTTSDKVYWLLFSTCLNLMLIVVIIYWSILHNAEYSNTNKFFLFETIDRHGIIFVLFVIEYFFNTIPVRILHIVYPAFIGSVSVAFNYAYYRFTGKLIYPIFNWKKSPATALESFGAVCLLAIVLQFICFGIDMLKRKLGKRPR